MRTSSDVLLPSRWAARLALASLVAGVGVAAVAYLTDWGRQVVLQPLTTPLTVTAAVDGSTVKGHTNIPAWVTVSAGKSRPITTRTDRHGDYRVSAPLQSGSQAVLVTARETLGGWYVVHARAPEIDVRVGPTPPPPPILVPGMPPTVVPDSTITIAGRTRPGADVVLKGQNLQDTRVTTRPDGTFSAQVILPKPGRYTVHAYTLTGQSVESLTSTDVSVEYDRVGTRRSLAVSLTLTSVHFVADVTVPRDDDRAARLMSGNLSSQAFLDEVLDHPRIDGEDLLPKLSSFATITIVDGDVRVRAEGDTRSDHPSLQQEVTLSGSTDFPRLPGDAFTLNLRDYRIDRWSPPGPESFNGTTAVWRHSDVGDGPAGGISARVVYDPRADPLSLTALSPYTLVPRPFDDLLPLVFGLLVTLPVSWFQLNRWRALRRWRAGAFDRDIERGLRALVLLALLGCLPQLPAAAGESLGITVLLMRLVPNVPPAPPALQVTALLLLLLWIQAAMRFLVRGPVTSVVYSLGRAASGVVLVAWAGFAAVVAAELSRRSDATSERLAVDGTLLLVLIFAVVRSWPTVRTVASSLGLRMRGWRRRVVYGVALLLLAVITIVWHSLLALLGPGLADRHSVFELFQQLVPPLLTVCVAACASRVARIASDESAARRTVGVTLFSGVLVGSSQTWFALPLSFPVAALVFAKWILLPGTEVARIEGAAANRGRPELLEKFAAWSTAQRLRFTNEARVKRGDVQAADYVQQKQADEAAILEMERSSMLDHGTSPHDVALSIGPRTDDWSNGLWAARHGLLLAAPVLVVYSVAAVAQSFADWLTLLPLWFAVRMAVGLSYWWAAGFVFGYFFTRIRGRSGLEKGTIVGLASVGCMLPVWLLTSGSAINMLANLLRASGVVLFFTLLGLWAFDYRSYRDALRERFSWRQFVQFGDLGSVTALASALVTFTSVLVSSALAGQGVEIVTRFVNVVSAGIAGQVAAP